MNDPPSDHPRRKRPVHLPVAKRGGAPVIVFLTITSSGRRPVLASPAVHEVLRTCWIGAVHWQVGHYIILPDHLHLFCAPRIYPATPLRQWVSYWKRAATLRWPGGTPASPWHPNFWDTQLRTGDSYTQKWDYVRGNAVRHGYVKEPEEWPYQGEMETLLWM